MATSSSLLGRPRVAILAIFAVALLLRLAVACWLPERIVWPDGYRYVKVAQSLLAGQGFGDALQNMLSVPTQPLLIAAVEFLCGGSVLALRLFFATLGAATCVVGMLIAKELFDARTALITGLLAAFYPLYVYMSPLFEYPQTFFTLVMGVAFLTFYRFLRTRRPIELVAAGACLGLAALSVPTVLVLLPVFAASLWPARVAHPARNAAILLLCAAVPVGTWTLRNFTAYGHPILVNQAGGLNFWLGNNETYYREGKSAVVPPCALGNERKAFCLEEQRLWNRLGATYGDDEARIVAFDAASWREGVDFLRAAPVRALELTARKAIELWSPEPETARRGAYTGGRLPDLAAELSYLPILALALLATALTGREAYRLLPIYGYLLTFTAAYAVFLPTLRYRLPLDLFLIVLAAEALNRIGAMVRGAALIRGVPQPRVPQPLD